MHDFSKNERIIQKKVLGKAINDCVIGALHLTITSCIVFIRKKGHASAGKPGNVFPHGTRNR
jgi:hypothetical protein